MKQSLEDFLRNFHKNPSRISERNFWSQGKCPGGISESIPEEIWEGILVGVSGGLPTKNPKEFLKKTDFLKECEENFPQK